MIKPKQPGSFWFSKLSAYQRCPRLYKHQYIDHTPTKAPLSAELEFGTALHEALATAIQGGDETVIFDMLWTDALRRDIAYDRFSWKQYNEMGYTFLRKFRKRYLERIKPIQVEKRLFGKLGKYKFEGTPDTVAEFDGVTSIIDWKTTAYPYARDKIRVGVQLMGYATLVRPEVKVKQIVYFPFVKTTQSIQTPLILPVTDAMLEKNAQATANWIDVIKKDKFCLPNPTSCFMGKHKCPYFEVCWNDPTKSTGTTKEE